MWKCEKCGDYRFNAVVECHCKEFTVIGPDDDIEFTLIQAMDHEGAAKLFAEDYNLFEDRLIDNTINVIVESPDGVKKEFTISAEESVNYYAIEKE